MDVGILFEIRRFAILSFGIHTTDEDEIFF